MPCTFALSRPGGNVGKKSKAAYRRAYNRAKRQGKSEAEARRAGQKAAGRKGKYAKGSKN